MPTVITNPQISFAAPEFYGDGISVKQMQFRTASVPFKSTYFEILPGFTTPVDRHQVQECWVVLQGAGVLNHNGNEMPLKKHDVMHFNSQEGHSVTNNSDEPMLICSIYW